MPRSNAAIVWFRHDLRLTDQPALDAALASGGPLVPVFIWSPEEEGAWPSGAASRWCLHQSLASLDAGLHKLGSRLIVRMGDSLAALREIAKETSATGVYWNRRYEPAAVARDTRIKAALRADGLHVESFNGGLLFEPTEVRTQQGKPFQVFTPFWRACLSQPEPAVPLPSPIKMPAPRPWPESEPLAALKLEPRIDWTGGIRAAWKPGEMGAMEQLQNFLDNALAHYDTGRDQPGVRHTSRLSPHLHFGEISPRQVWQAVYERQRQLGRRGLSPAAETFLKEVGWREFAQHLLFHFPRTSDAPLREQFANFPWREDQETLSAWQQGQTGYPLVDAGMRELWTTGWMHNRVRMVVASFLVKHLLLDWRYGAKWFWDTLVDADLANNTLGWQWSAGCGADAAPYFRIFNPLSQSEKFDPAGDYIRRWVPELSRLSERWIHRPWDAPADELLRAGMQLGSTYPLPIVDHAAARARALAAFAKIRT